MNHQISTETLALIEETMQRAERIISGGYEGNEVNLHNDRVAFEIKLQSARDAITMEKYRGIKITIDLGELLDFVKMAGLEYEFARSVNNPNLAHLEITGFPSRNDGNNVFTFDGTISQGE